MGNKNSSKAEEDKEELERQRQIKSIDRFLKEHGKAVEGISHSVQTQMALVDKLYYEIKDNVSVRDIDGTIKKNEGQEPIRCCHCTCTSKWQESTQRLLGSVQSSLLCQSDLLYGSFQRLNSCVRKIKEYYRIEEGTSVDNSKNKFYIEYEGSPTMDYKNAYEKSKTKVDSLKQSNEVLETEKVQLKETIQRHEKYIMDKDEELQNLQNENARLESKLNELNEKSEGLEQQIQNLQSNVKVLRTEKNALEQGIDKSKQTITVQLFHNLKGGMIATLLYELKSMLATQLNIKRHEVQFLLCQTETDVNPQIPIFVFCINSSRLGTDAGLAIQNLKVSSKMAILIFHHKDVHALPNQASERVLTEPEFKGLGGIFDIGFLSGKGIYACDMNRAASAGIESFLRAAQS
ncbi:centrosomal protein of 135 kDa-like [Ruditapes philippinarum]|uniref:centrosomal protein of 135 kDa-like n=1 Tax=Ruditapes philippinarum TaxID=129788 RepID=UPI00295BA3A0|nr:centrosomal protein of 135 kDa-like [Ruditapes philippinarum]